MKNTINLIDWRAIRHRQQCLHIYQQGLIFILCQCLVFSYFATSLQHNQQEIQQKQRQIQQFDKILNHLQQQHIQLQQTIQEQDSLFGLSALDSSTILSFLSQFPIGQGELSSFELTILNQQQAQIQLQGLAYSQQEFEEISHFLNQQNQIKQIKLIDFVPENDGKCHFEFNLSFHFGEK